MKTKPMSHQVTGLARMQGKRNFALFAEMGTGKTWMTLADAERLFLGNRIDAILIICPNGVQSNWTMREIPTHLEVPNVCFTWKGRPTTKKKKAELDRLYCRTFPEPTMRIMAMNIDAIITKAGLEVVEEFLRCFRVLAVMDESKKIGNPKAKRTEQAIRLGRMAEARRILSGKPLTKSPTDLFSQFDFLKEGLLGTTSYRAFVAEYSVLLERDSPEMVAIMRKLAGKVRGIPQVVKTDAFGNKMYKNLDKLTRMLEPHMFRVRKDEVLDLPPKVYKIRTFELDDKQRRAYDYLKDDYAFVSKEKGTVSFEAIAARTKMKQVTSGFIHINGEPVILGPSDNPRMELFKDIVEDLEHPFIVWAIYKEEIKQIVAALEEMGIDCVEYHGGVGHDDREMAINDFQAGKVRAFVCNKAAYAGITLTAARTSIYYSCDFDNDIRSQSEDRCHRIGTIHSVLYIDLVAEDTIDEDVIKSLAMKNAIADRVIDGVTSYD